MKNEELDLIIEKSLKSSNGFHLPADFARKVTVAVVRHEQWKNDLKEYLFILGIIISLMAVAGGLYYYLDKGFAGSVTTFVSGNLIQVIGVIFILNFILLADRVLLPLLFNRVGK
ncbi:MAG TPA: hypothetical protein VFG54_21010 [Prolixibacteraceae bacterium]|nr:hypothetical protein [Prolixibacteraceae bacterium]